MIQCFTNETFHIRNAYRLTSETDKGTRDDTSRDISCIFDTMSLTAEKIEEFANQVSKRRGALGVRAAAKEIGISPATLSRIENQHVPDLATFAAVCAWLKVDPSEFLGLKPRTLEAETATVHLRKRNTIQVETAEALGGLIIKAQEALRDLERIG